MSEPAADLAGVLRPDRHDGQRRRHARAGVRRGDRDAGRRDRHGRLRPLHGRGAPGPGAVRRRGLPGLFPDSEATGRRPRSSRSTARSAPPSTGPAWRRCRARSEAIDKLTGTGVAGVPDHRLLPPPAPPSARHPRLVGPIDLALCPEDVPRGCPWPDLVLAAMLRLGVEDVRETAFAHGTASGVLCGRRSGAGIVAGVLTGGHTRDRLRHAGATHLIGAFPTAWSAGRRRVRRMRPWPGAQCRGLRTSQAVRPRSPAGCSRDKPSGRRYPWSAAATGL